MMPLSTSEAQVIKLINTPKLPETLIQQNQPIRIQVISSQQNQATILLAGRQLTTQTNQPLTAGQTLTVRPSWTNGQLQLTIIPTSTPDTNTVSTQANIASRSYIANSNTLADKLTTQLPSWTNNLPDSTKAALASIKTNLADQQPLQQLLTQLNTLLSQTRDQQKPLHAAWQTLLNQALSAQTPVTGDKIQQAMRAFNEQFSTHQARLSPNSDLLTAPAPPQPHLQTTTPKMTVEWKQALINLVNNPKVPNEERSIAQGILQRTEMTQQLQQLQHQTGQAVWLQEIPIKHHDNLDNFTLEIDLPKPNLPEHEQYWNVFVQLMLDNGCFSSRIQLNKAQQLRIQLWGDNPDLLSRIQQQAPQLRAALSEQGIEIESMVIVQGKPETRTERPLWQHALVDCHG